MAGQKLYEMWWFTRSCVTIRHEGRPGLAPANHSKISCDNIVRELCGASGCWLKHLCLSLARKTGLRYCCWSRFRESRFRACPAGKLALRSVCFLKGRYAVCSGILSFCVNGRTPFEREFCGWSILNLRTRFPIKTTIRISATWLEKCLCISHRVASIAAFYHTLLIAIYNSYHWLPPMGSLPPMLHKLALPLYNCDSQGEITWPRSCKLFLCFRAFAICHTTTTT